MNINSKLLDQLLPHADTDELTFIPVYRIYLEMLGGDYESSALLAEILRLQNSEGGKANGGWVVFSYNNAKKRFFMARTAFTRALNVLSYVGLKTERRKSPHYDNSIMPYHRIDIDVLKRAVVNYHENGISPLPSKKDKGCLDRTGGDAQTVQGGVLESYTIEEVSLEGVIGEMQTPATKVASLNENSSFTPTSPIPFPSKKKATPNIPPNQTGANLSPAPRPAPDVNNRADDTPPKKGYTGYELIFGVVKREFFGIADSVTVNPHEDGKAQRLAGWLWSNSPRPDNEDIADKARVLMTDVKGFVKWYSKKMNGAILPHSPESLATHWLAYLSTRPAHTPTASYTMETWGGAKIDTTNSPANGGGGDTMELDNNIFGFLFGKREDNGNE